MKTQNPPSSPFANNLTSAFSAELRPVFATFTLVSALDVPDEELEELPSAETGNHRIGTIVSPSNFETCAQFTRRITMHNPSFLEPIWKKVASHGEDINILLCFGDGSKSEVYVRHVENDSSKDPIMFLKLFIVMKILKGNGSCVVEPNGE